MPRHPRPANDHQLAFPIGQAVTFDRSAFDESIESHGCFMVHYRSMACPVGLSDPLDVHRPGDDHASCSNGFIYTLAGTVETLFLGNSNQAQQAELGNQNESHASASFRTTYLGEDRAFQPCQYDRLFLAEENITVPTWERGTFSKTGKNKLKFPVAEVVDLMDSRGVMLKPSQFSVQDGLMVVGSPPISPEDGRGLVFSVRYLYRPYWYIKALPHEVRVDHFNDPVTGERVVRRFPHMAYLEREYVFESEDSDNQVSSARQVAPPSDQFGPR